MEKKLIPDDINYDEVKGICLEARQKLNKHRPHSIGQASRISGVSPADISVLLVYLQTIKAKNKKGDIKRKAWKKMNLKRKCRKNQRF